MNARLDIDVLRTLKAVADFGGVTKAADHLCVTQSAVSHKIRRLESSVGKSILRREAGAPLLTEDGELLLAYGMRIISLHDEVLSAMHESSVDGQVRLGITEGVADTHLVNILARFSRVYPSATVKTHAELSLKLINQLEEGKIDIAILNVFEESVLDEDRIVGHEELVWVESKDFHPSKLAPVPYISFTRDCFCREWAEEQLNRGKTGVDLETVLECRSVIGVNKAVSAGLGVTLINKSSMNTDCRIIDLGFPTPPKIATVLRARQGELSHAAHVLMEEISAELNSSYK